MQKTSSLPKGRKGQLVLETEMSVRALERHCTPQVLAMPGPPEPWAAPAKVAQVVSSILAVEGPEQEKGAQGLLRVKWSRGWPERL